MTTKKKLYEAEVAVKVVDYHLQDVYSIDYPGNPDSTPDRFAAAAGNTRKAHTKCIVDPPRAIWDTHSSKVLVRGMSELGGFVVEE